MTVSQLISQGFDPSPGTGSLQGPLRHPGPKTALWLSETYLSLGLHLLLFPDT